MKGTPYKGSIKGGVGGGKGLCRYFQSGYCSKGPACPFEHAGPSSGGQGTTGKGGGKGGGKGDGKGGAKGGRGKGGKGGKGAGGRGFQRQ